MTSIIAHEKTYRVEFDRESDGRWIAEIPELPGVLVYGRSQQEALMRIQVLALERDDT